MLGKKEDCDAGTIESPKATVVTYVEQDPEFAEGSTVRDAVYGSDNPLMRCDGGAVGTPAPQIWFDSSGLVCACALAAIGRVGAFWADVSATKLLSKSVHPHGGKRGVCDGTARVLFVTVQDECIATPSFFLGVRACPHAPAMSALVWSMP